MQNIIISDVKIDDKWKTSYDGHFTITNKSNTDISNWYLTINYDGKFRWISDMDVTKLSDHTIKLVPTSTISTIKKNKTIKISFGTDSHNNVTQITIHTNSEPTPTSSDLPPPGKIYNLSKWKLQLPLKGSSTIEEVSPKELSDGYISEYFYTTNDKAIAFWVPSNGYTTPNSNNPRSELREEANGGDWNFNGKHILSAECAIIKLPSTQKGIIIGQIHGNDASLNPQVFKLYWGVDNKLTARFKNDTDPSSGSDVKFPLGQYKLGDRISYNVTMVNGQITVTVTNNGKTVSQSYTYKNSIWQKQTYYFKAGNYFQINSSTLVNDTLVYFYAINARHS